MDLPQMLQFCVAARQFSRGEGVFETHGFLALLQRRSRLERVCARVRVCMCVCVCVCAVMDVSSVVTLL